MLLNAAVFLAAAVILVPLCKRLGLGAVLGYLLAGLAIGPWGLRLLTDVDSILHFSEFGVVLFLFVVGLELQPSRLWRLRREVFLVGGGQVFLTMMLVAGAALAFGLSGTAALVTGFGLAMSSTAFVLTMLAERKEMGFRYGRLSFAILLFQDLAVIPFLALVPLLAGQGMSGENELWLSVSKVVSALALLVLAGRYLLRPLFRFVATTQLSEVFTAAALLVVIGTALAMDAVGLSMSLGAFLAGVLLADSEYRHELQADIEPFKGLLLGLFFMAVGMSANLGLLLSDPLKVLGLVAGLLAIKAAVLYALGRIAGADNESARALAISTSQGGEFAFVLFGVAAGAGILDAGLKDLLVIVVTLSMTITPPLFALLDRLKQDQEPVYDEIRVAASPVIIAGFGPFGQIVGRLLRVKKIAFTVLERDWQQVDFVRRFG
ncbi:MAG: monovalent cation:proton antiporter-2 (CPA2) family protein, partial [Pseudomonadota bacterium]